MMAPLCTAVDAEQQEILELILRSLGEAELYYLRALLMVSTGLSLGLLYFNAWVTLPVKAYTRVGQYTENLVIPQYNFDNHNTLFN